MTAHGNKIYISYKYLFDCFCLACKPTCSTGKRDFLCHKNSDNLWVNPYSENT